MAKRIAESPSGRYYVRDTRTTVGNCILWWAKDAKGYTCHLDGAHVYREDELGRFTRATDVPWPVEIVDHAASLQVDHQRLKRVAEAF